MATVAEFTLAADEFPLGTVFANLPDVTVQLERVIPDPNGVIPYFWVRGTDSDSIVEQFSKHPGVRDIQLVDSADDEYLMRCMWISEYDSVLDALIAPEVVLLSAIGTATEWTFELRGETRKAIAEFREYCHDHDVPVTLTELHALRPLDAQHGLTDTQREALILAYECGYFESPRETTLAEIAEELGISQQALGSRLRRGNRRLVEQALIESHS
ncbi:helix-turn-helix domain-containing protein [Natronosalvus amylolyticus]|uniref:helix-turn-helix domain-containing protein n=1 Tax=Natronosalvus amylolyticus TaxID=2961994 RepID=UPI0020C9F310|nr:helix-turn-helix domain-containing protein [Natronosalvus amylolyticus]